MVEPGLDVRSPVGGVVPETRACLSDTQERAFERHARRFGHEAGRLSGGAELVSYPIVPSIAEVRALSAATPGQRRRRQQVFFNPVVELRRSIGQGVHDRLEAAVFADGTIVPADEARTGYHFPFPTRVLSVRHRDVRSGESWDLSVRGDHWGLDDRDDIMNVVNVGRLRLEPGATVLVRGNLLILIVQQLICEPGERGQYQLAILPTPFSVDNDTGPLNGPGGPAGLDGACGAEGVAAPTERTWLGARPLGPVVPGAADGSDGGGATAGGDGARGRTGGASKLAEITIGDLAGSLTILATAGRGGDGGAGGPGGRGGDGGEGAPGQRTLQGVILPGSGGNGGRGGDGGRGGRGGSGGRGGAGGQAGAGGAHAPEPGAVGVSRPRPDGSPGLSGADGRPGHDGRARAAPPVFVNERAVEPMPAPTQVPPPDAVRSLDTRRGAVFTSTMGEEGQ